MEGFSSLGLWQPPCLYGIGRTRGQVLPDQEAAAEKCPLGGGGARTDGSGNGFCSLAARKAFPGMRPGPGPARPWSSPPQPALLW